MQCGVDTKCKGFTMTNKLRMYARDYKLQWDVRHLPTEDSVAGVLLRAEVPSLTYLAYMSTAQREKFIRYFQGSSYSSDIPEFEVLRGKRGHPRGFPAERPE